MTAAERIEEARGRAGLHAAPGDMVEVELPEALGKALWDRQEALLEKGAGHKYIRRVPTGKAKPKYRYFYSVSGGKGVGHHSEFKVGASFRLDQDGQEGHFHVLEVRPDMSLRVRHDETGHETTVSPGGLDTMLRHQHGQAMKQHGARLARDVRAAIKHGTEKQVRRLEDEAKRYHWTRDAASIGEGGRAAAAADRAAKEYEKKLDAAEEKAKAEETERRKAGVVLYEQVSPWRAFQTKHEGASVGDVALFKNDKTPRVVVARHAQYIREDGLSFGIDDDSGWKITYTVRPLTEPERAEWDRYAAATKAHASTAKAAKEVVWGSHKITGAERPEKAEIPSGCRDIIIRGGGAHSPPNMIRVEPGEKHAWLMRYVGASSGAGNSGSYVATRVPFTGKVKEVVEWIDAGHKQPERPTFKVSEADKRKGPAEAKRKQAEQWERGRAAAVAALRAKGSTSPGPSAPPKPSAAALLEDTSATTDSLAQALSRENNRGLGARALVGPTDEVVLIGNTYEHKDDIRQAGGRWNSASRQWTMPDPHAAAVAMGFDLSDKAKAAQLEQRVARNKGKAERREQRIARNKAAREAQEKARASSPATPAPAPVRRGLRGEKAGRRVYVQGNTYEHKDALRGMGFKWDPSERAWWTGTANWKQNQDEVEALGKSDVAALLASAGEALARCEALSKGDPPVADIRNAIFTRKPHPVGPAPRRNRRQWPFQGTVDFQGLKIRIENKAGSTRRGVSEDGRAWATPMRVHYGEFIGTEGVDGDPVDVFVGPNQHAPFAYVVHSQDPKTREYDECKVMLGFDTLAEALAVFRAHFDRRGYVGATRRLSVGELREWLANPDNKGRRITAGTPTAR